MNAVKPLTQVSGDNTVGHTEIYAWGERVRHIGYGLYAVLMEPRIPCL